MGAQCSAPPAQDVFEQCTFESDAKHVMAPSAFQDEAQSGKDQTCFDTWTEDSTRADDSHSGGDPLEPAWEPEPDEYPLLIEGCRYDVRRFGTLGTEDTSTLDGGENLKQVSVIAERELGSGPHASVESIQADIEESLRLYEEDDDVIGACSMLAKVQAALQTQSGGSKKWRATVDIPCIRRLISELELLKGIGRACCSHDQQWACVYKNAGGDQSLHVCFDSKNPYCLQYRLHVGFPVKLTNALAIASEVELSSHWNSFLVGPPQVLSRKGCTRMVVASQISVMLGCIKNESLDEIRRYVDEEAGIVAESMCTLGEDSPLYYKPKGGFKRADCTIKSLWVACGPEHTTLMQHGCLKLPFQCTKTMLTTLAGLVGKYLLAGLVRNALRTVEPGNPWEDVLSKDPHGFYRQLDRCVLSEASQSRCPSSGLVSSSSSEISSLLDRRQLQ